MRRRLEKLLDVAAVAMILASGANARSATVYSTGFENPPFTTGTVIGQDGWYDTSFGSDVEIQTALVKSGQQALRAGSGAHIGHAVPSAVANQVVNFEYDVMYTGTEEQIALIVSTDTGNLETSLVNGDIGFYSGSGSAAFQVAVPNTWFHMRAILDFPAQTITGYVDGNLAGTIPMDNPGTATTLTSLLLYNAGGEVNAYFDNLNITTTTVPEPASIGLLSLATGGLIARRRRVR